MNGASDIVRNSICLVLSIGHNVEPSNDICEMIGRAITLGKAIVLIVKPGCQVPPKLASVVDRYIEWVDDPKALGLAIRDAMVDLELLTGGQCGCEECKKKANADSSGNDGANSQN